MARLKETFSKGITTINVKTNNFMESTTIKTHINTLESECKALYEQIGATVYQQWTGGDTSIVAVETYLQQVKGKQEEIAAEYAKLDGLQKMEEDILGKKAQPMAATPVVSASAAPVAEGQIFCSQCGSANSSNYKFCCKCGAPLAR